MVDNGCEKYEPPTTNLQVVFVFCASSDYSIAKRTNVDDEVSSDMDRGLVCVFVRRDKQMHRC